MDFEHPEPVGSHFDYQPNGPSFGFILLTQLLHAQEAFKHASYLDRLSFIEACLRAGFNTERAIVANARALGGEGCEHEISQILQWHATPTVKPHLWYRTTGDRFGLREVNFA